MASFVIAVPDAIATASSNLSSIGSAINAANAAAASRTTEILAAGQDEVSAAISRLFGTYAQEYQTLSVQTALFHDQFTQALTSSQGMYQAAEATNAFSLQTVEQNILGLINARLSWVFT